MPTVRSTHGRGEAKPTTLVSASRTVVSAIPVVTLRGISTQPLQLAALAAGEGGLSQNSPFRDGCASAVMRQPRVGSWLADGLVGCPGLAWDRVAPQEGNEGCRDLGRVGEGQGVVGPGQHHVLGL